MKYPQKMHYNNLKVCVNRSYNGISITILIQKSILITFKKSFILGCFFGEFN